MNKIFRVSVLGLMAAVFTVVGYTPAAAQETPENCEVIYKRFLDNYKGNNEQKKVAIQAGKELAQKCSTTEGVEAAVGFVNKQVPVLEKIVGEADLYGGFNNALKDTANPNVAGAFAGGKNIIAQKSTEPVSLDVALVLASLGFDNAVKNPPVDTFNNDAVTYAKMAIQKLESGMPSDNWGAYKWSYAIKTGDKIDPVKSKNNALGWMNYTVGTIMFYRQNMKKEALPYFYKATQVESGTKNNPDIYRTIGAWYLDELIAMEKTRQEKIAANQGTDSDETKAMWAMIKGYADRAIDAYARAYKIASADTKVPADYKTALYTKLTELYKIRYNDKTEGIDAYVSTVMNKPMPDPSTAVTPVVEDPTTATTTTTSSTTTTTTVNPSTKPTTDTTVKPTTTNNTTTTKPSTSSTTTKTKTATVKKKGTR